MIKRLLCIVSFVLITSCAAVPPLQDAVQNNLPNSIAVLEPVTIGGITQWISIRGNDAAKPVLLFLHGGPGSPELPIVRHADADLEKDFVVVVWDQRGAGKSFSGSIPKESMTIAQFVSDAHELTAYLKTRFKHEKIFLIGHSWGSLLGMHLVQKYPTDYYAYIGIGQFVNGTDNELLCYEFTLREAKRLGDTSAVKKLEKIGKPEHGLYTGDWVAGLKTQRNYLVKFGGALYGKTEYDDMGKLYIHAPEYTIVDLIGLLRGMRFSLMSMWPEVITADLEQQIPSVDIPCAFFSGRHDYNTPFTLSERYLRALKAPKKKYVWFENSAHNPNFEEGALFSQRVKEFFLSEIMKKQ